MYYCYNAEYLFFPFCETRTVGEMLAFHTEERRDAMLTYVIDLYADDLDQHPNAVSLDDAHLDRSGYYALARPDADEPQPPQGAAAGFLWRVALAVRGTHPRARRKIDRIALFRAKPGLKLREDHTFSDEEYNTYACPVAPQPDGRHLFVPHRQGAEAQSRLDLRYRHLQMAQFGPVRMAFAAVAGSWV